MPELKLPRSTPAAEGLCPRDILGLVKTINQKQLSVHSLMLLRHGRVVAEGWWNPVREDRPHLLFSLTKSFTSTAIGFAVQEGLLSLEDNVLSFFDDALPCRPCEYMGLVKIRHLLTHTTGFDSDPMCFRAPKDRAGHFLRTYLEHEPGSHFAYTDDGPDLLSAILQKCTGQTLEEYLAPRLFTPLGITGWHWSKSPDGYSLGGTGLCLKTEDIAKFGQFLLQRGEWDGVQLLSADWVQAAASRVTATPGTAGDWAQGYGYLLWQCVPEDVFRGDGAFGQFCIVLPRQDMVVVLTGGNNEGAQIMNLLWETLLPAQQETALPESSGAQSELEHTLATLSLPTPVGEKSSPLAARYSGVEYELSPNPLGLTCIRFDFGTEDTVLLRAGSDSCRLPIGFGEWREGRAFLHPDRSYASCPFLETVACAGAWNGGNYHLEIRFPAAPYCYSLNVAFGEAPILRGSWNVSFGPLTTDTIFARQAKPQQAAQPVCAGDSTFI